MNQFIYNYTDLSTRDFVSNLLTENTIDDSNVDGVFFDGIEKHQDIWNVDEHWLNNKRHPYVSRREIASIIANQRKTMHNASHTLFQHEKLVWQWFHSISLPTTHDAPSACTSKLTHAAHASQLAPTQLPGLYGNHCVGPYSRCANIHQQLAMFLIVRGPYSIFFGNDEPPFFPPLSQDYGAPLAPAEIKNSTFTRDYVNCKIEFNCENFSFF